MTEEIEQDGLFEEPAHLPPRKDGPWSVTPPPGCWRYQFVGEDGERLMIEGHVPDEEVRLVLLHAGARWEDYGEGLVPADRTWATELDHCPRHWRWPWRLRRGTVRAVDWVRHQVFRVLWKLLWSRDPLRQWWRPRWLTWTQRRWRQFEFCQYCEWIDHYRGEPNASFWTWDTDGGPDDVNRGRVGYIPVTVVDLEV